MKTIKTIALFFAAMAMLATACTPADKDGDSVNADLTELNAAIAACEDALADAEGSYPADAISTLQTLVTTAKAAAAKGLSQTAADNLTQQLITALATFEATKLEAVPASALAFALSFDEGQGTSLTTTGANQWTANLMAGPDGLANTAAPTFVDGKKGKALKFANGGHIEISDYAQNVLVGNEFSISAWLKVEEAHDANFVISYNTWHTWKLNIPSHGKPFFTVATNNGIVDMDNETDQSVPVGEWAHLVVVCNTTVGSVCFYVNGSLTKEWTVESKGKGLQGTIVAPETLIPLCIGAESSNAEVATFEWVTPESPWGSFFRGIIDEFKFYNVALTAGQAAALYNE